MTASTAPDPPRPHGRAPAARRARLWPTLVVLAWGGLACAVLLSAPVRYVELALCATTTVSAVACAARVRALRTARLAWALLAAGWTAYAVGFAVVLLLPGLQHHGPGALNLSDTVSLLLYPLGWAGLVLLAQREVPQRRAGLLLDAGTIACAGAAGALSWAALALPSLLEGSAVQVVYALSYPVGGATLLVVLLTAVAVGRRRLDACWALLLAGLVLMTLGDAGYGIRSAQGTFAFGTPLDLMYTAGPGCAALAAWCRRPAGAPPQPLVSARLAAPAAAMLIGVGLLVLDHSAPLPGLVVALAATSCVLGVARTVTFVRSELAAAAELREALSDDLTGLWTRRALLRAVDERVAEGLGCRLVLVDLTGVEQVNDTLGHAAGDALLVQVAHRLRSVAGDRLVARLVGDEFAVLDDGTGGTELVPALLDVLVAPVDLGVVSMTVPATAGSAAWGPAGPPVEAGELLRRARVALDTARRTPRTHLVYEPRLDEGALERLALASELQQALVQDEIVVHQQLKVSCSTGQVHGLETLVRWQHPSRGLLAPGAFVAAAESAGLLPALTRRVLALALTQVQELRVRHPELQVAVNLGAPDLLDPGFVDHVQRALAAHRLPAQALRFEVTETVVMSDPAPVLRTLHRLRALGIGISLDDYGTGLASLSYLRDLPVDELKIDRSFVSALTTDPTSALIVTSTIELAHGLGLTVVAEGIEDVRRWRPSGCRAATSCRATCSAARCWPSTSTWGPRRTSRPAVARCPDRSGVDAAYGPARDPDRPPAPPPPAAAEELSMTVQEPVRATAGTEHAQALREVEQRVLWLATAIVDAANRVRPNPSGLKVGGHQASSASMVTIMTSLWLEQLAAEDRVSVKPHASPVLHALEHLLGQLDASYLPTLRAFGGLQSYPSRTKDPVPGRLLHRLGRDRRDRADLGRARPPLRRRALRHRRHRPAVVARRRRRARRGRGLGGRARPDGGRARRGRLGRRPQPPVPGPGRARDGRDPAARRCSPRRAGRCSRSSTATCSRSCSPARAASTCGSASTP